MDHKLNLKKQLACIYTSDFFSGLRITDAVWVALLAARGSAAPFAILPAVWVTSLCSVGAGLLAAWCFGRLSHE